MGSFYIALAQIFNGLTGVNGAIIINSKYYKYELITNIFLVFITLITNYFFIKIYGIEGAAIATAISIFLQLYSNNLNQGKDGFTAFHY